MHKWTQELHTFRTPVGLTKAGMKAQKMILDALKMLLCFNYYCIRPFDGVVY